MVRHKWPMTDSPKPFRCAYEIASAGGTSIKSDRPRINCARETSSIVRSPRRLRKYVIGEARLSIFDGLPFLLSTKIQLYSYRSHLWDLFSPTIYFRCFPGRPQIQNNAADSMNGWSRFGKGIWVSWNFCTKLRIAWKNTQQLFRCTKKIPILAEPLKSLFQPTLKFSNAHHRLYGKCIRWTVSIDKIFERRPVHSRNKGSSSKGRRAFEIRPGFAEYRIADSNACAHGISHCSRDSVCVRQTCTDSTLGQT